MLNKLSDIRSRTGYKLIILFILLVTLFIVLVLSIGLGSIKMSFTEVFHYLFIDIENTRHNILLKIRTPRTLAAGLVGCSLALSGCLLQGVMRNPLASPNVIGVSAGAGFTAVIILILFPGYYYLVTPMAFIGAFGTTIIVYLLAGRKNSTPLRLILSGIAISSFLGALSNSLMIYYPDRIQNVIGFMVGNLTAVTWENVMGLWPYSLSGLIISWFFAGKLNILLLGDETAISLGLKVEQTRMILILTASLLAAAAVSVVGLLGFVGLIVPHLARLIIGNNSRYLLPCSALMGAIIVMLCDMIGRVIIRPLELPVGIIMSVLGGPFFLYLLRRDSLKKKIEARR